MHLAQFINTFNKDFVDYLEKRIQRYKETLPEPSVSVLVDHLIPLFSQGKRIRPYIIFLGAEMTGGDKEIAKKLGIAIELFHGFALIHADIIDKATQRRGVATIETKAREEFAQEKDQEHLARSQALLIGDLVYAWALELLYDTPHACREEFFAMIDEVVTGQMIDVGCMKHAEITRETIIKKIDLKTGSYTFVRPLRLGMHIQGASIHALTCANALGLALGRAFQMQDDILDAIGNEHEMGKERMRDIEQGEQTLLTQFIFTHAPKEDQEILRNALGKKLSATEKDALEKIFVDSGAIKNLEEEIASEFVIAKKQLHELEQSPEMKAIWEALVHMLEHRRV